MTHEFSSRLAGLTPRNLAALRRAVTDPWDNLSAAAVVAPLLEPDAPVEPYVLLAALYAWHPHHTTGQSFAGALHHLRHRQAETWANVYNVEFRGLLDAYWLQLPHHLFRWVKRLAAASIPLDWDDLAAVLVDWQREDRIPHDVARAWARAVWVDGPGNYGDAAELLTAPTAAVELGVHRDTTSRAANLGQVTGARLIGPAWVATRAAWQEWFENRRPAGRPKKPPNNEEAPPSK